MNERKPLTLHRRARCTRGREVLRMRTCYYSTFARLLDDRIDCAAGG
jgi:hypothetical protein